MDKREGLPKIKKNVSAFLSDEDGQIMKKSMITMGSIAGGVAIAKLLSDMIPAVEATSHTDHTSHSQTNDIIGSYEDEFCRLKATHQLHSESTHANYK